MGRSPNKRCWDEYCGLGTAGSIHIKMGIHWGSNPSKYSILFKTVITRQNPRHVVEPKTLRTNSMILKQKTPAEINQRGE